MVNLLFISNSPRAELLRVHFQQILKMRIEVVEDFDRGLKDVFEKRPVAVCIQDQISGVTGESVARHIQLLLGNGAPAFILMHDASAKAKAVPGLFNQLVDLSGSFEVVCKNLQLALQAQLADHWDKIYTPPVQQDIPTPEKAVTASLADQLIDEFVAENSIFNPQHAPPLPYQEPSGADDDAFVQELPGGPPAEPLAARQPPEAPSVPIGVTAPPVASPQLPKRAIAPQRSPQQTVETKPERHVHKRQQTPPVTPVAAEKLATADESSVPVDELLQAFEENYRSSKRMKQRIASGVVLALAVLLLVWATQKWFFSKPYKTPVKQQPAAPASTKTPVQPVASSASTSPSATQPVRSKTDELDTLPSFIPKAGHDPTFSASKPGWSRYLSKQRDYRLFQTEGRLKALQVLVVGTDNIAPAELKQILQELTGSDLYRTVGSENRGKLKLERARVSGQAELLVYRSSSKGPIKAIVLQLTP